MNEFNWNPTTKELRVFGILLLPFSVLMAWILQGHLPPSTLTWILIGTGSLGAGIGIIAPSSLRWVYIIWMTAVFPIGWVVTHVVLALVFYLVLTPTGIIMRLTGRKTIHREFDRELDSYWEPLTSADASSDEKERYFRQF